MVGPNKRTHIRAQCSHASVGLAQARPNELLNIRIVIIHDNISASEFMGGLGIPHAWNQAITYQLLNSIVTYIHGILISTIDMWGVSYTCLFTILSHVHADQDKQPDI